MPKRRRNRNSEFERYCAESKRLYEKVKHRKQKKNQKKAAKKPKNAGTRKKKIPRYTVETLPAKYADRPAVLFLDPPYPGRHPLPEDWEEE